MLRPFESATVKHFRARGLGTYVLEEVARALVGLALIAWLPGWAWVPLLIRGSSGVERVVYAIGVSIASMTLIMYVGSAAASIAITASHVVWYSIAITLAGFGAQLLQPRDSVPSRA